MGYAAADAVAAVDTVVAVDIAAADAAVFVVDTAVDNQTVSVAAAVCLAVVMMRPQSV